MSKNRLRGRAAWTCVLTLACASAIACDSVLDIEDPKARPAEGEEPSVGGAGGAGGSAGSVTALPEAGAAGEGGIGGAGGTEPVLGGAGSGGEAGAPITPRDCETDSVRCTDQAPEICDASGNWVPNVDEADGDCAVACLAGRCVECQPDETRCAVCEEGDASCNTNQPQACVDGVWTNDGASCKHYCDAGSCITPPSCKDADDLCTSTSCCNSLFIPGGTFSRDYDGGEYFNDNQYVATISPFLLDKFEVTVGRMKRFVAAYPDPSLVEGKGKSQYIEEDSGWLTGYELPATQQSLVALFNACVGTTWSDANQLDVTLPANCVPFNVAYAFCIWDGGRLPTDAEWNFAAAGGDEQRSYPWKPIAVGDPITNAHARYESTGPTPVGSKPLGDGRWGHADLAGNVSEWTLDYYQDYLLPCKDCLNATPAVDRVARGGGYSSPPELLAAPLRGYGEPSESIPERGFRCAREITR